MMINPVCIALHLSEINTESWSVTEQILKMVSLFSLWPTFYSQSSRGILKKWKVAELAHRRDHQDQTLSVSLKGEWSLFLLLLEAPTQRKQWSFPFPINVSVRSSFLFKCFVLCNTGKNAESIRPEPAVRGPLCDSGVVIGWGGRKARKWPNRTDSFINGRTSLFKGTVRPKHHNSSSPPPDDERQVKPQIVWIIDI